MFGFKQRSKGDKITKTKRLHLFRQKGVNLIIDNAGTKIEVKFGNAQHIGARKRQEDSFGYSNISNSEQISQRGILAVLADGMGGLSHGKEISDYVVSAALNMFEKFNYSQPFSLQLENMIKKINDQVSGMFSSNGKSGAGSTIVLTLIYKTKLYWACVGDSRLYLLRDGYLYQVNEDHDYLNQLLLDTINDDISLAQALTNSQKDSLTSYIGNEKLPLIDMNRRGFSIQKGDKFVLCSDGIYSAITNAELIELLHEEPQVSADKTVRKALSKKMNSQDNLTIMIINYD